MEVNGEGTFLAYTDDIVILEDSQKVIEVSRKELIRSCKKVGLNIIEIKTKYIGMRKGLERLYDISS